MALMAKMVQIWELPRIWATSTTIQLYCRSTVSYHPHSP